MLQFAAVTLLGLVVAYLAKSWVSWYGDFYTAAGIWIAACLVIAFIYDRRNRTEQ
jgi:hypothetical protein